MGLILNIKKSIIRSAFKKRMKNTPDYVKDDAYELPIEADENQNNSYFFGGYDVKNKTSIVMRLGIRNPNLREVFVFVQNEDGFFVTPKDYYTKEDCPLKVECIESTHKWKVDFKGILVNKKTKKETNIEFSYIFTSTKPMYDFFYSHLNESMVTSVASPKWDKDFKESNHSNNQRHLEQPGILEGTLKIEDKETYFKMPGGRDRSFGKRIWSEMYDHIWLFAYNEKGEAFNFSLVNYPIMKNLRSGWSTFNSNSIKSITNSSILEYDHNKGKGTDTFHLNVTLEDGQKLDVIAKRLFNQKTNYQNGEYYFQEAIGTFDINGEKFYGSIEYGYNKNSSLWSKVN